MAYQAGAVLTPLIPPPLPSGLTIGVSILAFSGEQQAMGLTPFLCELGFFLLCHRERGTLSAPSPGVRPG